MQRLLAIESSCDETAACVMGMDGRVYSNIIASQIQTHALYGGVVPEIASRMHVFDGQPCKLSAANAAVCMLIGVRRAYHAAVCGAVWAVSSAGGNA